MAGKTLVAYLAKDGSDSRPRMILIPRDPEQPVSGVGQGVTSDPAGLQDRRRFHRRAGLATTRSAGEPAGAWALCPVRGARGPSTADRSASPGTSGAPSGTPWSATARAR